MVARGYPLETMRMDAHVDKMYFILFSNYDTATYVLL